MRDKIAVEEHYAGAETLADSQRYGGGYWADTLARLPDFEAQRLPAMDRAGIARTVLSLNAPAVQAIPEIDAPGQRRRRAAGLVIQPGEEAPDPPDRHGPDPSARLADLGSLGVQDESLAGTDDPGVLRILRAEARSVGQRSCLVLSRQSCQSNGLEGS